MAFFSVRLFFLQPLLFLYFFHLFHYCSCFLCYQKHALCVVCVEQHRSFVQLLYSTHRAAKRSSCSCLFPKIPIPSTVKIRDREQLICGAERRPVLPAHAFALIACIAFICRLPRRRRGQQGAPTSSRRRERGPPPGADETDGRPSFH